MISWEIIFAFLSLKNPLDSRVYNVINSSYKNEEFLIFDLPPLPGILDYFISELIPYKSPVNISHLTWALKCLLFLTSPFSPILFCLIFSIPDFSPSYALIFSVHALFTENIFLLSLFLSLSLVSDLSCIFLIIIILGKMCLLLYVDLVDKSKPVLISLSRYSGRVSCIIFTVMFVYLSTFYVDYQLRPNISQNSNKNVSLEFGDIKLNATHEEVIHGSLISILNRHFKSYISVSDNKLSGMSSLFYWRISKVDGEGSVKDGDLVRFVNIETQEVLSVNSVNQTDKFHKVELKPLDLVIESKNDIFRIKCDKILTTRTGTFEIVNMNTGLFLGMRRLKDSFEVYASAYGNKKHREFYVSDNERNDGTTKKDLSFPRKSFISKVVEHTLLLISISTYIEHNKIYNCLVPFIFLFLVLNQIYKNRGMKYREIDPLFLLVFINSLCLRFVFCRDSALLLVNQILVNYMFLKEMHYMSKYMYIIICIFYKA
ncbi:dolichyl-phosphate-mannose protein mannosyltransferase [Vairimorpha necatrix]|uniref:Dolichyl-phosphate-mannose protein mannosyltransferase n=1 Tax=Vairimorpha necatrix TaxID=6039 RepID=A0AAX4JCY5_9MICR